MTFAKRKKGAKQLRKGILRKMKKLMKKASNHAMNHLKRNSLALARVLRDTLAFMPA